MITSTTDLTQIVNSPAEISSAAVKLRQAVMDVELSPNEVMTVFDSWAKSLDARELDDIPGIVFLRMWLRRGTLEPIIARELGANGLSGGWNEYGRAECKAFPLGVVGHWPAANVEIQPILSMTCALLGGNAALVRIPSGLVDLTRRLMEKVGSKRSRRNTDPAHFYGRLRTWPAGFARSHGSSRRRSNDLGRGRSCFAGSGTAVSTLGEIGSLRAPDIRRRDGRRGVGQSSRTRVVVPAHGARCLAIRSAGMFLTPGFVPRKREWPVHRSISAVSSARL